MQGWSDAEVLQLERSLYRLHRCIALKQWMQIGLMHSVYSAAAKPVHAAEDWHHCRDSTCIQYGWSSVWGD